jgi:hypothetical protein
MDHILVIGGYFHVQPLGRMGEPTKGSPAQLGGIGGRRGEMVQLRFSYLPARFDYGPALPHPPGN